MPVIDAIYLRQTSRIAKLFYFYNRDTKKMRD